MPLRINAKIKIVRRRDFDDCLISLRCILQKRNDSLKLSLIVLEKSIYSRTVSVSLVLAISLPRRYFAQ